MQISGDSLVGDNHLVRSCCLTLSNSQSFNAVNQLRVLGRWMRMVTIPNQSSAAQTYKEFDEHGRMKPSAYYERLV